MKFIIAHEYYIIHMLQFIPLNNRSFRWKFNNSGETLDVGKERHHHNGSTSVLQYTPVTDQVSIHFIWCFPLFSRLYSSFEVSSTIVFICSFRCLFDLILFFMKIAHFRLHCKCLYFSCDAFFCLSYFSSKAFIYSF